jgi:hypothetical protein
MWEMFAARRGPQGELVCSGAAGGHLLRGLIATVIHMLSVFLTICLQVFEH